MSSESNSNIPVNNNGIQKKSYKRGPYKTQGLYRTKTIESSNDQDCFEFHNYLKQVRENIRTRFGISPNRSKVLNNIQGLLDCFQKQIAKKASRKEHTREDQLEGAVISLNCQLESLKDIIEKLTQSNPQVLHQTTSTTTGTQTLVRRFEGILDMQDVPIPEPINCEGSQYYCESNGEPADQPEYTEQPNQCGGNVENCCGSRSNYYPY